MWGTVICTNGDQHTGHIMAVNRGGFIRIDAPGQPAIVIRQRLVRVIIPGDDPTPTSDAA